MKKLLAIALMGLLLVPLMVSPAWSGGGRHGGGGWHGGHGGCCWGGWGFAAGVGLGALATAPLWYPPAYAYPAYPAYAYPAYAYPAYAYPAYSYPAYSYPAYPPPAYRRRRRPRLTPVRWSSRASRPA